MVRVSKHWETAQTYRSSVHKQLKVLKPPKLQTQQKRHILYILLITHNTSLIKINQQKILKEFVSQYKHLNEWLIVCYADINCRVFLL